MQNDHVADGRHPGKTVLPQWLSAAGPVVIPRASSINYRLVAPVLAGTLIAAAAPPLTSENAVATRQARKPTPGYMRINLSESRTYKPKTPTQGSRTKQPLDPAPEGPPQGKAGVRPLRAILRRTPRRTGIPRERPAKPPTAPAFADSPFPPSPSAPAALPFRKTACWPWSGRTRLKLLCGNQRMEMRTGERSQ